jgi:phage I-like protein
MSLERVILNWPTALDLKDDAGAVPRSWIQLAKTGSFVSKRYGKFSITREDLGQMLHNFTHVTPKAPTLLPVDWDHLSMDAARVPENGAAAGWMKKLELRDGGDTLWAEVEWTPKAAGAIKNREYQFVSPSFAKDYTHKDGRKIGTTLLAAAITNHPFLQGMQALTLRTPAIAGVHLSVALRDLVAVEAAPSPPEKREVTMKPEERILMRAQIIATERQISLSAATKLASREEEAASREYLAHPEPTAEPSPVLSLRRDAGETLPALVARVARERCNGDQVAAYRLVASAHPDLVSAYSDGATL